MILEMKQKEQEMFESGFMIVVNGNIVGEAKLRGSIGSMEGTWNINYANLNMQMVHSKNKVLNGDKPFRPYEIFINGQSVGSVYQTDVKDGGLFSKYPIHKVFLNNNLCILYPICFGDDGAKSPVYCQSTQIAEVHKSSIIYNELHSYTVYMTNENCMLACIALCCYSYVLGFYKPGQKVTTGVKKLNHIEKNKGLLSKYNPNFIKSIQR